MHPCRGKPFGGLPGYVMLQVAEFVRTRPGMRTSLEPKHPDPETTFAARNRVWREGRNRLIINMLDKPFKVLPITYSNKSNYGLLHDRLERWQ